MRNGVDITTASALYGPSRINPVAKDSPRAFYCSYDYDWEQYVVNLKTISVDSSRKIREISLRDCGTGYTVLIYGISVLCAD